MIATDGITQLEFVRSKLRFCAVALTAISSTPVELGNTEVEGLSLIIADMERDIKESLADIAGGAS